MGRRWSVQDKKVAMEYAKATGNDAKSHRWLELPQSTYFIRKRASRKEGAAGLIPNDMHLVEVKSQDLNEPVHDGSDVRTYQRNRERRVSLSTSRRDHGARTA